MIELCYRLVDITKEGRRWKCVDSRLPEMFQGECTLRNLRPRMVGGFVLERVNPDVDHKVTVRLGGIGNEAYPHREYQSIDIEYIEEEKNENEEEE